MDHNETPFEINGIPINIYGGFWRRLGALCIDILVLLIPIAVILYINSLGRYFYFYTFLPYQIFLLYFYVYLPKEQGGTPGKLILEMKIIRIDGHDLTWQNAFLRYIVFWALSVSFSVIMMLALLKADSDIYTELSWANRNKYLLSFYPIASKVVNCLNYAWVIFSAIVLISNNRKRAIHDYMAGTVVVKSRYLNSLRKVMDEKPIAVRDNHIAEETSENASDHTRFMP